jgi:hypothetical protein
MLTKPILDPILDNDALTRGLGDAEARVLVEWLVDQAERFSNTSASEAETQKQVETLCRRARAISRFVGLWCHLPSQGAAAQLAAAERFTWPMPRPTDDPYEIMQEILIWEAAHANG